MIDLVMMAASVIDLILGQGGLVWTVASASTGGPIEIPLYGEQEDERVGEMLLFAGIVFGFAIVSTVIGLIGEKWLSRVRRWIRTAFAGLLPSFALSALLIVELVPRHVSLAAAIADFVDMPLQGFVFLVLAITTGLVGAALSALWLRRRRVKRFNHDGMVFE